MIRAGSIFRHCNPFCATCTSVQHYAPAPDDVFLLPFSRGKCTTQHAFAASQPPLHIPNFNILALCRCIGQFEGQLQPSGWSLHLACVGAVIEVIDFADRRTSPAGKQRWYRQ